MNPTFSLSVTQVRELITQEYDDDLFKKQWFMIFYLFHILVIVFDSVMSGFESNLISVNKNKSAKLCLSFHLGGNVAKYLEAGSLSYNWYSKVCKFIPYMSDP